MVVSADLHLRADVPACRGETEKEWMEHQANRLSAMFGYAESRNLAVGIAGDVFHKPKPGYEAVGMFLKEAILDTIITPGNHDLLYTQEDVNTGYAVLSSILRPIETFYSVADYNTGEVRNPGSDILFIHTLTFENESDVPFGVSNYETSESLVAKYPGYKYIVVGDMHKPFSKKVGDCWVVNCGSMTVQSRNEAEYEHGFWHIKESGPVFIPYTDTCIVKEQVDVVEIDSEAVKKLFEKLNDDLEISAKYLDNVRQIVDDETVVNKIITWSERGVSL